MVKHRVLLVTHEVILHTFRLLDIIRLGTFQVKCPIRIFTALSKLSVNLGASRAWFPRYLNHIPLSARSIWLCPPPPHIVTSVFAAFLPKSSTPPPLQYPQPPLSGTFPCKTLNSCPYTPSLLLFCLSSRQAAAWAVVGMELHKADCRPAHRCQSLTNLQQTPRSMADPSTSSGTLMNLRFGSRFSQSLWKHGSLRDLCSSILADFKQQKILEEEGGKKIGRQRQKQIV